jgi:hypothetical protein
MPIARLVLFSAAAFAISLSPGFAGPCSDAIDTMQARIDALLEAKAAAGPTAKEGIAAGMSDQPTPRSMAAVEEKLGEISPQTVDAVRQGMARAGCR